MRGPGCCVHVRVGNARVGLGGLDLADAGDVGAQRAAEEGGECLLEVRLGERAELVHIGRVGVGVGLLGLGLRGGYGRGAWGAGVVTAKYKPGGGPRGSVALVGCMCGSGGCSRCGRIFYHHVVVFI